MDKKPTKSIKVDIHENQFTSIPEEVGHAHVRAYICIETVAKRLISTKQHSFNCLPYV